MERERERGNDTPVEGITVLLIVHGIAIKN